MESINGHRMRWYALRVQPRFEKAVSRNLQARGYEKFLPLARHRRYGTGRVKEITTPLFPGFVFCRFSSVDSPAVLEVPGVTAVAGLGTMPLPVDEKQLNNVRTLLDSGLHCQPWPFVTTGEAVSVERGSLSGLEGIVTNAEAGPQLVVSVSLLRRSVAVKIDRDDLRPVGSSGKCMDTSAMCCRDAPSVGGPAPEHRVQEVLPAPAANPGPGSPSRKTRSQRPDGPPAS